MQFECSLPLNCPLFLLQGECFANNAKRGEHSKLIRLEFTIRLHTEVWLKLWLCFQQSSVSNILVFYSHFQVENNDVLHAILFSSLTDYLVNQLLATLDVSWNEAAEIRFWKTLQIARGLTIECLNSRLDTFQSRHSNKMLFRCTGSEVFATVYCKTHALNKDNHKVARTI